MKAKRHSKAGSAKPRRRATLFEGFDRASAETGIPVDVLKAAKRAGCPAFIAGGRIQTRDLAAWISAHDKEIAPHRDSKSLKDQKLGEEIRRLKLANDERAGTLIPRATVIEVHSKVLQRFKEAGQSKLITEAPLYLSGQDVPAVRVALRKVWDELIAVLRQIGQEEWNEW